VSAAVLRYFARENAGQCGSCFNGTAAMSAVLSALVDGGADESDVARLVRWTVLLPGRGACGTLDAAVNVARNVVERFGQEVQDHLAGDCAACNIGPRPSDPPFAVAGSLLPVVPAR
jgi:NADH:ubiquinone oxidoreductase subunit F (NADH-binding)